MTDDVPGPDVGLETILERRRTMQLLVGGSMLVVGLLWTFARSFGIWPIWEEFGPPVFLGLLLLGVVPWRDVLSVVPLPTFLVGMLLHVDPRPIELRGPLRVIASGLGLWLIWLLLRYLPTRKRNRHRLRPFLYLLCGVPADPLVDAPEPTDPHIVIEQVFE